MDDDLMSLYSEPACSTKSEETLQPHAFFKKTYFRPTYCDVCEGIILGSAYKCSACNKRCHIGYGKNGKEDCHSDALLEPCDPENSWHVHGTYRFGDISKQKTRDMRSRARRVIRQAIVEEQKEFGKFDRLKDLVDKFHKVVGDEASLNKFILQWQLLSVTVLAVGTILVLSFCRGLGSWAFTIGIMQAASNAAWLLLAQALVALLVRLLSVKLRSYSTLIQNFASEVFQIELQDLGIDLLLIAAAGERCADCSLSVTMILLFAAFGIWVQAIFVMASER